MKNMFQPKHKKQLYFPLFSLLAFIVMILTGCNKLGEYFPGKGDPKQELGNLKQINLVANKASYGASRLDPLLLNAWGIAFSATGTPWISSTGAGVTTIYNRDGDQVLAAVGIPSPTSATGGLPTGTVFNGTTDFVLSNGQPGRFLYVGLDGIISGWNGPAGSNALVARNDAGRAVYTGLALARHAANNYLYAANAMKGTVDIFDKQFKAVSSKLFVDKYLPAGYVPFNIHLIGDKLYVAYSKLGPDGRALRQAGNGIVNIFTADGVLVKRFAEGSKLNAPWGIAMAPAGFFPGKDAQAAILIGNFGDGKINAYTPDGKFIDQLKVNNKTVAIDGLWEITFAPSTSTIDPNRLYFAAGPDDEKDGLFGYLVK